jgi:signal transduction histidine kinase
MEAITKRTIIRHGLVFLAVLIVLTLMIVFTEDKYQLWTFFALYSLLIIILHYMYVSVQKEKLTQMLIKEKDMIKQRAEAESKSEYLRSLRKKRILEEQVKAIHSLLVMQNHQINSPLNGIMGYSDILKSKIKKLDIESKSSLNTILDKIKKSGEKIHGIINNLDDIENPVFKDIFNSTVIKDLAQEDIKLDS